MAPIWPLVDVESPHELVQRAGLYNFSVDPTAKVIFRGHRSLHDTCHPSGVRGLRSDGLKNLAADIYSYVDELMEGPCTCSAFAKRRGPWHCDERVPQHTRGGGSGGLVGSTPRAAVEPLLQHYGLRTRWVDVVDNIWIALWFACHRLVVETEAGRYAHHMRRSVAQEPDGYAYVSVLSTGPIQPVGSRGCWEGPEARLIDLRAAAPSIYLRPHAQHGLLVTARDWSSAESFDLAPLHQASLRIRLGDALEWLGDGTMLRPYVLFPPATEDHGFRRLLEYAEPPPDRLGPFLIYGPGN